MELYFCSLNFVYSHNREAGVPREPGLNLCKMKTHFLLRCVVNPVFFFFLCVSLVIIRRVSESNFSLKCYILCLFLEMSTWGLDYLLLSAASS